ncbi:chorismate mutase [Streptomyces sp. DSM 44915]|uniref:Chorismate mutase n=1 Tax=Streptomyces chisholmiae TaxID=3075540 RepID=A0ABU2JLT3_9ACTN|nr:chorismate mutase [Streptomyces sp. DSM 44915]MDT0265223.1 chorismate mutase [Streptomyces sp. DSM 44915]
MNQAVNSEERAARRRPSASPAGREVTKVTEPADPAAVIAGARAEIDALDTEIVRLVRHRMTLSARVQHARMASGGRRVQLARENEVLRRWRAELGVPGTTLAMTLLELCRGRI